MGHQDLEAPADSIGEKTRRSHRDRHYAGRVTALATYPRTGPPQTDLDPRLRLGHAESLPVGVKRLSMEQFEHAASGFFDGEELFPDAVHEARKSVKRVRALLGLVQGDLGERVYRYEDTTLRDTSRMLAETRSATSVAAAAILIRDLYGEYLAEGTFEEMISRIERRRDVIQLRAMEDPNLVGRVVHNLEKAYHRYSSWPTDPDAREVYGTGMRDSFAAIGSGLHQTYSDGRRRMVTAYTTPSGSNFHEWRKKVKSLRHQMEFLSPLWPEVIGGLAVTLDWLGLLLGEDHDHADLLDLLRERPDMCPNQRERSVFFALVTQRRAELRIASEVLGRRVYAEKPNSFRDRFGEYWESRSLALSTPLDTLVVY
jgi:CHAD domain-containing protein